MSLLAIRVGAAVLALLALFALRGKRWAYLAFVVLGLLSYPAQAHWRVHAPKCQLVIPTMQMVVLGVQNYVLVAVFAVFCWMSWVQFRWSKPRAFWALLATVFAGALVEIAEGMTARGSCRVRDLVPAAAAGLGVALVLAIWGRLTRKPGYVRIGRPRSAAATRQAVPPPKPVRHCAEFQRCLLRRGIPCRHRKTFHRLLPRRPALLQRPTSLRPRRSSRASRPL